MLRKKVFKNVILFVAFILFSANLNTVVAVIPDDVHILNNDPQSIKYVLKLIVEAPRTSVYGALKMYPDAITSKQLEQSFINNPSWYIGVESRHSAAELQSMTHCVGQSEICESQTGTLSTRTLLPLNQIPELNGHVYTFNHCDNAHPKFLLTWDEQKPILLLGTNNLDVSTRDSQGQLIQHWYGADENCVALVAVIRSPYLIGQFINHLLYYLPNHVALKVKDAYHNILSTKQIPSDVDGKTLFAWGPKDHKQQLLNLIDNAQISIKILQQDLTDKFIQNALIKAAHKCVQIAIIMSETPFARNKPNNSLGFLQKLTKIGNNVTCQLTGCKGYEHLPMRHVHAKFMAIDDMKIYVGSANFYEPILNPNGKNLNVGIITEDVNYTKPLLKIFNDIHSSPGSLVIDNEGCYQF